MSWWDYGYQITAMANRTILVDNNTWNNTHISRVGQAMASDEAHAYEIMKELDVDYVLVIFGGLIGYSSDGKDFFLTATLQCGLRSYFFSLRSFTFFQLLFGLFISLFSLDFYFPFFFDILFSLFSLDF